ncbi:MAG TPA: hypothetical protein VKX40_11885 [Aequorivita sp.]|nr:hypothetical protein [Aequorivita sp.]
MKNSKTLFSLALLLSTILISCTINDDIVSDDHTAIIPCTGFNKNLLTLSTTFDNDPNAEIDYNYFLINNLDSSLPNSNGSFTTNTDLTFQLPTSTSFYNQTNNLHGILVTRAGKYFSFNTNTEVGQEFVVPTSLTAPIELNNSTYVIEVSNGGYANSGIGNHYEIKSFDINTGTVGATLPIDPLTKDFDNNSFFHVESISAATNNTDELYYLSGTNLVTVNTSLNTASHIDLYPSFSSSDYVRFFGLEYSESLGLIAIMDNATQGNKFVVKIDPLTGNYSSPLSISNNINSEFYSTTYRECDHTYYLTSLNQGSNTVQTLYFEFDLITNNVINSQIFPDYTFGIEFISETP